jgi:hypothetical protein
MAARVHPGTRQPIAAARKIGRKKASQGNDVLTTRVSKRKVDRGEREDRAPELGRHSGRPFVLCDSPRAQLWQSSQGAQPNVRV